MASGLGFRETWSLGRGPSEGYPLRCEAEFKRWGSFLGLGLGGLGFRVQGLGFRVWGVKGF